jgi:hypothetical protein
MTKIHELLHCASAFILVWIHEGDTSISDIYNSLLLLLLLPLLLLLLLLLQETMKVLNALIDNYIMDTFHFHAVNKYHLVAKHIAKSSELWQTLLQQL